MPAPLALVAARPPMAANAVVPAQPSALHRLAVAFAARDRLRQASEGVEREIDAATRAYMAEHRLLARPHPDRLRALAREAAR